MSDWRLIFEYYFEGINIDTDELFKQPEDELRTFIELEICPNWRKCKNTLKLRNELEKYKFVKQLSHKAYMKELTREKRSIEDIKKEYRMRLQL